MPDLNARVHFNDSPGDLRTGADLAYLLLEEARLHCARLAAEAGATPPGICLGEVHRELGIAGWYASVELDANRRLALLATAHQRSRQQHDLEPSDALAERIICGEDTVAEQLTQTTDGDHMHLAHIHVLQAMHRLADHPQLTTRRSRQSR